MTFLCRLIIATAALLVATPAHAWGELGHRLVGDLAQRHLAPAARAEVAALLAGEAEPTLGGVAMWADHLRDQDPARFKETSRRHYVSLPEGVCRFDASRDCPDGDCVVVAIEEQARILADRTRTTPARRDALKFVVHFVGDAHQPMHAGNRPDRGGNDFQISLRTDIPPEAYAADRYVDGVMGTNLHSVWDYYILAGARLDRAEYARRLDAIVWPSQEHPRTPASAWTGESCRVTSSRSLYPAGHKMDHAYLDAMRPLAEQRIRQAGYRLALMLNGIFQPALPVAN
ncbi:MAG: S1/P1 nuclease [Lysobacter sp.]|nr:S1/P1 nuclease [Lysobacter sp.]MDQ3269531.1 S1/P1 nuclease [Pseudomonadota bacterium]